MQSFNFRCIVDFLRYYSTIIIKQYSVTHLVSVKKRKVLPKP